MAEFATDDARRARLAECLRLADPAQHLGPAAAAQAALEARELALSLASTPDIYRATAWLARHRLYLGQLDDALELADELLRQPWHHLEDARVEALRVAVLAGSETARFDQALGAAEELVALAARHGDAGQMLSAAAALAAPLERMGASWQAERVLSRALKEHGSLSPAKDILSASNALCAICAHIHQLLRGTDNTDEAIATLARGRAAAEQALAATAQVPNPAFEVVVRVNLAEILIGQGEHESALALLLQLRDASHHQGLTSCAREIDVNLADVLQRLGRQREALDIASAIAADGTTPATTRSKAHLVAYQACKSLSDFAAALTHFEQAERIERGRLTMHLRAQSELFVTRAEELQAQHAALAARLEAEQQRHRATHFEAQAEQDALTGLGNRRHLERRATELLPALSRRQAPVALAQIDVDHFKQVNDRHGHAAGDKVLEALGRLLRTHSRSADVVVRSGGEEFMLVLPDTLPATAIEVCERLRAQVEASAVDIGTGVPLKITISVGIAMAPPYDLDALAQQADKALYAAKRSGRNRLCRASS